MDDTLILMKKSDVLIVLQAFNGFHKNLNFTVDTSEDKKIHFLDLLIDRNTTDIYFIKIPILVNIPIIAALCHGN